MKRHCPSSKLLQLARHSLALYFAIGLATCLLCLSLALPRAMAAESAPSPVITAEPATLSTAIAALQQGKQQYEGGNLDDALAHWQTAALRASQTGDRLTQARALRYQAMAYQDLGNGSAATQTLQTAEAIAQGLSASPEGLLLLAQLQGDQGSLQLQQGRLEQALGAFQAAEKWYEQRADVTGVILSQLNQAQVLQALGFYPRVQRLLSALSPQLAALPESSFKGQALGQLSGILLAMGAWNEAEQSLDQSQQIFETLGRNNESVDELAETLFQRGNLAQARSQWSVAAQFYASAQALAGTPSKLPRLAQTHLQWDSAAQRVRVILKDPQSSPQDRSVAQKQALALLIELQEQPASHGRFYTQVNLARSLLEEAPQGETALGLGRDGSLFLAQVLAQAVGQARDRQDGRAEAHLLLQLANLYEQHQRYDDALDLTHQALALARQIRADDIAAPSLWKLGRILKAQGRADAAIAAYGEAVSLLQSLRQDLVAMSPGQQFSFRDQGEPVYRQLVQLLLTDVDSLPAPEKQARLERSRQTIEALQLAQVQDFLREACETYAEKPIEQIDATAAVFYSIVLSDRLEVILSLPGQPLQHYSSALDGSERQQLLRQLRRALNPAFPADWGLPAAQQLYDRLIRPSEALLQQQGIRTLVFVLDDFLRDLPMAMLHDGDRYLLEKYSLALTPGLQLFDTQSIAQPRLRLLAGGLSEPRQGFSALPGVVQELAGLAQYSPSQLQTKVLLDQNFTRAQLTQQVEKYTFPLIHLATHGQFSSSADETFLLTWDGRISLNDLGDWLIPGSSRRRQTPLELLILSACQTAKGDRRATLGLAGLAVRSGARSTLATLWSVQDQSTAAVMAQFYQQLLQQGVGRAEALRQAQLSLKQNGYAHPYYWAPFVLIGHWQS